VVDDTMAAAAGSELAAPDASRKLRNGLISLAVLVALVAGLLLAVPGLHSVKETVTDMTGGLICAAIALELLSCLSYVLAFLQVFDRAPIRFGARVALSELAFGAAVSLGGAGSVAVGAWLLLERGAPANRVAERSAVLFLLTSAVNVITLVLCGLGLFTGVLSGPDNPLLSALPAAVGTAVLVFFLALPRLMERGLERHAPGRVRTALSTAATSVRETRRLLVAPDWRILGAIGYLSNMIPIPGGIGVLDGSLVGMLVLYGASATTATAAALVYHAIALWVPAMWGTVAFLVLRRTRGTPVTPRPSLEERRAARAAKRQGS
jgi:uncharacterized membrane protein YbhN (UPF0104 family)